MTIHDLLFKIRTINTRVFKTVHTHVPTARTDGELCGDLVPRIGLPNKTQALWVGWKSIVGQVATLYLQEYVKDGLISYDYHVDLSETGFSFIELLPRLPPPAETKANTRFPHTCRYCGSPAYEGAYDLDCSAQCKGLRRS